MTTNDNKLKSFKWTRNSTLLLLSLIKEHYHQLEIGVKKAVFQQIANEMNEQLGTGLVFEQIESKWNAIRRTYKKLSDSKTGLRWEYYDKVDEIFKDNFAFVTTSPDTICETELDFADNNVETKLSGRRQSHRRKRRRSSGDHKEYVISYEMEREQECKEPYISKELHKIDSEDERNGYEGPKTDVSRQIYLDIEAARERRHQEKMQMAKKFLAIFEKLVEKI